MMTASKRMLPRLAFCAAVASALPVRAEDSIRPYLEKGPMVLVEQDGAGKFGQATSIVLVDAPLEKVWSTVVAFDEYKQFIPKVTKSEIVRRDATQADVRFVIDVPGPDEDYVVRYEVDEAKHEVRGTWLKGDLKGSRWLWRVESTADGKALLSQTGQVKNFSSIAQSLEDDQQTITVGVNVSSVLAATKAIKRRAEGKPTVQK